MTSRRWWWIGKVALLMRGGARRTGRGSPAPAVTVNARPSPAVARSGGRRFAAVSGGFNRSCVSRTAVPGVAALVARRRVTARDGQEVARVGREVARDAASWRATPRVGARRRELARDVASWRAVQAGARVPSAERAAALRRRWARSVFVVGGGDRAGYVSDAAALLAASACSAPKPPLPAARSAAAAVAPVRRGIGSGRDGEKERIEDRGVVEDSVEEGAVGRDQQERVGDTAGSDGRTAPRGQAGRRDEGQRPEGA